MKVISVINQKGGVGKTTSTYNISALLAIKGYKVLMMDNDGQASLTLACGYNPLDLELTMSDIYINNRDFSSSSSRGCGFCGKVRWSADHKEIPIGQPYG